METLKIEIELSGEELDTLNDLIKQGCIVLKIYLKRQITKVIVRHKYLISYSEVEPAKKAG